VVAVFEARRGRLHGFRWRDWLDWKSCAPSAEVSPGDQAIGVGDGETRDFQLVKIYEAGRAPWSRAIVKPVAGTVRVALDGIEQPEAAAWTVNPETGRVSFTLAPEAGRSVTAGFALAVPVRFDAERLELSLAAVEAGEALSIPVVEVRV
jgi:TIGR02217 family protein